MLPDRSDGTGRPDDETDGAANLIAFFQGAQREAARLTAMELRGTASGFDVAREIYGEVAAFYDVYLERLNPPFRPACAEGCDFCCHTYVSATIPEVLALAAFILETWTEAARRVLIEELDGYRQEAKAKTPAAIGAWRRPCPLLRGRRCSVYPARPLACRGWHSLDASACEAAFVNPASTHRIPVELRGAITTQLSRGIAEGARQAGCASTSVGLVAGLSTVLAAPGVAEAWRQGRRVFVEASDKALRKAMPDLDVVMK